MEIASYKYFIAFTYPFENDKCVIYQKLGQIKINPWRWIIKLILAFTYCISERLSMYNRSFSSHAKLKLEKMIWNGLEITYSIIRSWSRSLPKLLSKYISHIKW